MRTGWSGQLFWAETRRAPSARVAAAAPTTVRRVIKRRRPIMTGPPSSDADGERLAQLRPAVRGLAEEMRKCDQVARLSVVSCGRSTTLAEAASIRANRSEEQTCDLQSI